MLITGADLIFNDDPVSPATLGVKLAKGGPWGRYQIDEVVAGGPAFIAGLRRADFIVKIDGAPVAEPVDVEARLRGDGTVGSECLVGVRRGEGYVEVRMSRTSPRGLSRGATMLQLLDRHATLITPGKAGQAHEAPPWRAMSTSFDALKRHAVESEAERMRSEREASRRARNLLTDFLSEVAGVAVQVLGGGKGVEKLRDLKDALSVSDMELTVSRETEEGLRGELEAAKSLLAEARRDLGEARGMEEGLLADLEEERARRREGEALVQMDFERLSADLADARGDAERAESALSDQVLNAQAAAEEAKAELEQVMIPLASLSISTQGRSRRSKAHNLPKGIITLS